MKIIFKITCLFILSIFIIGSTLSCNSQHAKPLRIVYVEASSNLPFFIALSKGYFEEQKVSIQTIKAANSTEAINLLAADKADISIENNYNVIYAFCAKQPGYLRLVQPCYETKSHPISHLIVKRSSGIRTPIDIKRKKIGTFTGASQLLALKLYLTNKLKIDTEKDITIIQVDMNLQIQALDAGQYDALFTVEPYSTVALENDKFISIDDYVRGEIMDPFPAGATSIRKDCFQQHKLNVLRVINALDMGIKNIQKEGVAANEVLPKYTPLKAETALRSQVYEYKTLSQTTVNDEMFVLKLLKMYVEAGILSENSLQKGLFLQEKEFQQ
jgi:ABC-type nitrate/sulfonate/bicarbonate transport system substrate-binding protein